MTEETGSATARGADAFTLETPAVPSSVGLVRHVVRAALEAHGAMAERIADIVVATSEACSNAIVHAYRDGATGRLHAALELDAELATVVVRDWGRGMAPRMDSPGLGLGLAVIGALTERFEIRAPDDGGVELVMTFALLAPSRV